MALGLQNIMLPIYSAHCKNGFLNSLSSNTLLLDVSLHILNTATEAILVLINGNRLKFDTNPNEIMRILRN